jgi:hypothetical protein
MRLLVTTFLAACLLTQGAMAAVPPIPTPAPATVAPSSIVGSDLKKPLGTRHTESWRIGAIDGTTLKEPSPRNAGKKPLPIQAGTRTVHVDGLMLHSNVGQFLMLKAAADLTFDVAPGTDYVVTGEFGNGFARMWIEDKASGARISYVVEAKAEGENQIWCFGQVACDQIERRNAK